ncbi:MAG: hypothetical protein AAGA48_39160 [Myxococcota bacterium]
MVSNEVDELFSESGRGVPPRTNLVFTLVSVGFLIAITGLPCSAVPGTLIVLAGWFFAEKEHARLRAGFFGQDLQRSIESARTVSIAGVVFTALLMIIQMWLTYFGAYEVSWRWLVVALGNLVWGPMPEG